MAVNVLKWIFISIVTLLTKFVTIKMQTSSELMNILAP